MKPDVKRILTKLSENKVELGAVQDFERMYKIAESNLMKSEPQYGDILNNARSLNKEIKKIDEDIDNGIAAYSILEKKSKELGVDLDSKLKGNRGRLNNFKKTTTQILSELKNII